MPIASNWRVTGSATRSGPSAPVITTSTTVPGTRCFRQRHDPIDLRRFPVRTSLSGSIDENLDDLTDERVSPLCGDRVLELGALPETFTHQLRRDLIGKVGSKGADLRAEGEEAHPVQLCFADPAQELVVVDAPSPPDSPR